MYRDAPSKSRDPTAAVQAGGSDPKNPTLKAAPNLLAPAQRPAGGFSVLMRAAALKDPVSDWLA
jgi:hypothetical protein